MLLYPLHPHTQSAGAAVRVWSEGGSVTAAATVSARMASQGRTAVREVSHSQLTHTHTHTNTAA